MNDQPHTHQITVDSCGRLEYGDQYSYINLMGSDFGESWWPNWFLEWRVRRKIRWLIRKHDKASQKRTGERLVRSIMAEFQPTGNDWASTHLKGNR